MNDALTEFAQVLAARRIVVKTIIADGRLHRDDVEGKARGNKCGVYKLHLDGTPAGYLENFTDGLGPQKWRASSTLRQSPADLARLRARIQADQKARQKEADALHAQCRAESLRLWMTADTCADAHPYAINKGINPYGARVLGDSLLVPVRDVDGTLHGLQRIAPDGAKAFKHGTDKRGHFCPLEPVNGQAARLIICEGYATGCSLYSSFGGAVAVAVAFDAGNLGPVALALAAKYPQTRITIAGDVDASGVGQKAAREAAVLVGADVMLPDFSPFTEAQLADCGFMAGNPPSDFNDLHQLQREAR